MRHAARLLGVVLAGLCAAPAAAGGVAILGTLLEDNGDHDGFADTNETVELRLVLENTSGRALTDLILTLSTDSPRVSCIGRPRVGLTPFAPGQTVVTDPFVFTVGPVDRTAAGAGPLDEFAATFALEATGSPVDPRPVPASLTLDLDLNPSGSLAPATFLESFESGSLSTFLAENLDQGRNSLAASDGFRCQYSDPDWINSNSYGTITNCFLGATAPQADAVFWQIDGPSNPASVAVDGGRAFTGTHALYYGIPLNAALGHTTPLAVLESVRTIDPIHLGAQRVCSATRTTPCGSDLDCPPGESCEPTRPVLSFKHQVSLLDSRSVGNDFDRTVDRGVVMAQLADPAGAPVGPWFKLYPAVNAYDQTAQLQYTNCSFEPIDDGSAEDDFFDPADPGRRFGPSSTCFPELVYDWQGSTLGSFNPSAVGYADGPGLAGSFGAGTWVESRFDLSRFRGRNLRLRFLASSLKAGGPNWQSALFGQDPDPGDDGWWLDDVTVSEASSAPAAVSSDAAPNGSLLGLGDSDGDLAIDACDSCPFEFEPAGADDDEDGVGNACDLCPSDFDPLQADLDEDGLGDACDRCPEGNATDPDGDSLPCGVDNCPLTANPAQPDIDGDGLGDGCDACPLDAENDADGDGVCGNLDDCRARYNPNQGSGVRVSSPVSPPERVVQFALAPGASHVVHDLFVPQFGGRGLVAVPIDSGGAAFAISQELPPHEYVDEFQITADGARVVHVVKFTNRLWSAPLDGGLPVRLDGWTSQGGNIFFFDVTPNGSTVVFTDDTENGFDELYAVPSAGGVRTKLSGTLAGPPGVFLGFDNVPTLTPDSATAVYIVASPGGTQELFAASVAGGTPLSLSGSFDVDSFVLSPNGARVVFAVVAGLGVRELYCVPTAGGTPVKISGTMVAGGSVDPDRGIVFTPNSARVAFVADKDTDNLFEIYSVAVTGGVVSKLSVPLAGSFEPRDFAFSNDNIWFVYRAEGDVAGRSELYRVRATGGTLLKLNGTLVAGGEVLSFAIAPDGGIVYRADQDQNEVAEIYRTTTVGGVPVKLNGALVASGDVVDFSFAPEGSGLLYRADQLVDGKIELFFVPSGGGAAVKLSNAASSFTSVEDYHVADDDSIVVYEADELLDGVFELFAVPLDGHDPDADGVISYCDLCPAAFDPGQTDGDGDGAGTVCDCDDADHLRHPGATERCNGLDDDCDLALPAFEADADGDGWATCSGDCNDGSAALSPTAAEINDGLDNQCPGFAGHGLVDELSGTLLGRDPDGPAAIFYWPAQAGATAYEVARSGDSAFGAGCTFFVTPVPEIDDPAIPAPGALLAYLARSLAPNEGSWGVDSDGTVRAPCPP